MPTYVVIENTPGYMPEDDDPFETDSLEDAKTALRDNVERHLDFLADDPDIGPDGPSVSWDVDGMSCYVVSSEHEHDLGRVFEILEREPEVSAHVHRPAGKETHYGQTTEADPYDVDADWSERA